MHSDPDVARYVGGERPTPEIIAAQVESFTQACDERGYGQSAVFLRKGGQFFGRTQLHYWPVWACNLSSRP
ncbi:GNAT family N-acetyltransferase [Brachybacterium endophyticum]|uniref:GNAT family N-acetyltransferase n=1 Tax=Brachybacterium endophyticum TaxID=2182385 RepID=UPI001F0C336C